MKVNPFHFFIFIGFLLYLFSQIRKLYYLLPNGFKELEDKYIPNFLKGNIKKTWYLQSEHNRKLNRKGIPYMFLGLGVLILLKLAQIELDMILSFIKYIIIIAVILICLVQTYYYIKIYRKYMDLHKGLDIELREKVLKFTVMQCIGFIVRVILVIFILEYR